MDTDNLDDISSLLEKYGCEFVEEKEEDKGRFYLKRYGHPKLMIPITCMLDRNTNKALAMGVIHGIPNQFSSLKQIEDFLNSIKDIPRERPMKAKLNG